MSGPRAAAGSPQRPGQAARTGGVDEASSAEQAPKRPLAQRPAFENSARDGRGEGPADQEESGDNLSFDFSDEARDTFSGLEPPKPPSRDRWEVGEPPPPPPQPSRKAHHIRAVDIEDLPEENRVFEELSHEDASAAAQRLEAELRGRSYTLHSSGFFLGVFALFVFGFGLVSLVICGAPIASAELLSALPVVGPSLQPPVSPAERVALTQVQARYEKIKDNEDALIISGVAENVSNGTLGTVQIGAALLDPGNRVLRSQTINCGNNLSPAMVSEMTPRELEFFEKLGGPRNFTLVPQASSSFLIVFVAPPADASRFELRVAQAEPMAASTPISAGG